MSYAAELQQAHKARLERIAMAADRHIASKQIALLEPPKPEPPPEPEPDDPVDDGWVEPQHKPLWFFVLAVDRTSTGCPTIQSIQQATCDVYGVRLINLLSAQRTADIVRPRQVSMYLAKELTCFSLTRIARATGDRDHTTAIHAIRKIAGLLETDNELAERIAEIRRRLA